MRKFRIMNLALLFLVGSFNLYETGRMIRTDRRMHESQDNLHATLENLAALDKARSTPDLTCNIIHFPKDGQCPKGWIAEPQLFTWKDGTHFPGCVNLRDLRRSGQPHIDILLGGESVAVPVFVMIPESNPAKPQT